MTLPGHLQIPYARKEIAFSMWKRSGYTDHMAYELYMYWFKRCQEIDNDKT